MQILVDKKEIVSINKRLGQLDKDLTRSETLLSLAQLVLDMIEIRTHSHKDYNGSPFKPYTPKYANKKGVSQANVNLYSQNTGQHMLNDMAVRVLSNNASEVYFQTQSKRELALRHMTGDIRGGKKREFFAVNNTDIGKVIDEYQNVVAKSLDKNGF